MSVIQLTVTILILAILSQLIRQLQRSLYTISQSLTVLIYMLSIYKHLHRLMLDFFKAKCVQKIT